MTETTWRDAYNDLHDTLVSAQQRRDALRGFIGSEPEWVGYERQQMTDRVNLLRTRRGLGPVSEGEVHAKENMACGHVDYTAKFALYCADLVCP